MFDSKTNAVIDRVDRLRGEVDDHWQVPRDEAQVLAQLVRLSGATSICEIGASYGFSTLHLAAAAREHGGHVHTIDVSEKKVAATTRHLREAGLDGSVTVHHGDAREVLLTLQPSEPFDFVFFDAVKEQSNAYLDAVWTRVGQRVVMVTDNTLTHAAELADFVQRLRSLPGAHSCQVPVGNGFELTIVRR